MQLRSGKVIQVSKSTVSKFVNPGDPLISEIFKNYIEKVSDADSTREKINIVVDMYNDIIKHIDFCYTYNQFRRAVINKIFDLFSNEDFKKYVIFNKTWKGRHYYLRLLSRFNMQTKQRCNVINYILFTNQYNHNVFCRCYDCSKKNDDVYSTVNNFNTRMNQVEKINRRINFKKQTLYQLCVDKIKENYDLAAIQKTNIPRHLKKDFIYLLDHEKYPASHDLIELKKQIASNKLIDKGYTEEDFQNYSQHIRTHRSGESY